MSEIFEQYPLSAFVVGNGVNLAVFDASCEASSFAAKYRGLRPVGDPLTALDVMLNEDLEPAEKTALDVIVAAHDGTPTPGFEMVWSSQIMNGEKTCDDVTPAWTVMASTVGSPLNLIEDATIAQGEFVGDYKTSGAGCKVRLVEEKEGATPVDVVLKEATMPDTSGVYKRDATVKTDPSVTPYRSGRNRYRLEMQRPDAGTTCSLRDAGLRLGKVVNG